METAKLFWSGRSQAVRLPRDFRFDGTEVNIRRVGTAVILEPANGEWDWLDAVAEGLSDDFMENGREQPPMPDSPPLFD